jgi:DNA (cytosine-5)-methyltransferase 1
VNYIDVCAGISAPTVAWKPLGWQAVVYAEIADAPRAVLAHHYPDVPLVGDFTEIKGDEYGPVDALVGGTPCQSFSVAGLRGGLADDRGNLALEYLRLADRARPRWLVWENVPGVLSSNGGRDFGAILGGMVELGYGVAYGVLDAQHFGVPQRRRRVFVIGYLGDWRRAGAVLFERHSLQGHSAPRREAIEGVAIAAPLGAHGSRGNDLDNETYVPDIAKPLGAHALSKGRGTDLDNTTYIAFDTTQITSAANYSSPKSGEACHPLASGAHPPTIAYAIQERAVSENLKNGPGGKGYAPDTAYTLEARNKVQAVAFAQNQLGEVRAGPIVNTLNTNSNASGRNTAMVSSASAVRRLTPRECERLQGFPDDYTLVPHRGRMMADGPRYKCLGNSMAVPVIRWIGERIDAVEALGERLAA